MKSTLLPSLALALAMALASSVPAVAAPPAEGSPVNLQFTSIHGKHIDLASMKGKVVLIDFWATWCGPCVGEVPHVVEAYQKLHDKGFEIVGISLDNSKAPLLKFIKEHNMTWDQFCDDKGWKNAIATKFGIHSIPAMWLVDKEGNLATTNARGNLEGEVEETRSPSNSEKVQTRIRNSPREAPRHQNATRFTPGRFGKTPSPLKVPLARRKC